MATDVFLKLKGIEGESRDAKHAREIELLGFSAGVSMPVGPRSTAGSATTDRVTLSDICVTKLVDASSPALFKAACIGQHIDEALISVNRADSKGGKIEYLRYALSDVVLSSYQVHGGDGGQLPSESLSLNFAKLRIEYVETDPKTGEKKGAKTAGWDVALRQSV